MSIDRKPWLDADGNVYPNAKLMELKRNWSLSTWEEFLQAEVDVSRQEALLHSPNHIENCSRGFGEIVKEMDTEDHYPRLQKQIRQYLKRLSKKEQQILDAIFWEGKSQRQLAKETKVSRTAITNTRDRALKKLGTFFVENLSARISAKELLKAQQELLAKGNNDDIEASAG
ncbi:MAG: sigma factor-like helix-turn-helix DNA-binding protein [Oligoflexales bacterium]